MHSCPHCQAPFRVAELPHPGLFRNYRVCPACGGRFTVDPATRTRQAICLVIAVVSLLLTSLLTFDGGDWLIPAIASYLLLGWLIYRGNRQVFFVPYEEDC